MPVIRIDNVGLIGVISDQSAYEIPPEAWTDGVNVEFHDNKVARTQKELTTYFGSVPIAPYSVFFAPSPAQAFWAICGLTKVYGYDGTTYANITRQTASVDVDYSANADTRWNGGNLNRILVLNNGADAPQMWAPIGLSQKLTILTNWSTLPAGAGTIVKVLRPAFRVFLVGLGLTEGGDSFPNTLIWSAPAAPGTVPSSWNYSDPTTQAGKIDVADSAGILLDLVPLGPKLGVLYKEDSSYLMQFVGGTSIFAIDPLFDNIGILGTGCCEHFPSGHFLVSQDDILVHNGGRPESAVSGKVRRRVFNEMDQTYKGRSFVLADAKTHEMMLFYPSQGSVHPNKILRWNWDDKTCIFRNFSDSQAVLAAGGTYGSPSSGASQVWDADTQVWDADQTLWDQRTFDASISVPVFTQPIESKIGYFQNPSPGFTRTSFVERIGLSIIGRDRQGNPKSDPDSIKYVSRIIPRVSAPVRISIGAQDKENGAITWEGPKLFDPAVDIELPFDVTGRFIAVRFESLPGDVSEWALDGYGLDLAVVGRY